MPLKTPSAKFPLGPVDLLYREAERHGDLVEFCFAKSPPYEATMPRTMLSDSQWKMLCQMLLQSGRVYNKTAHRMTLEVILYRMRTGCPWRDLPAQFGRWNTVFRRFNLWSKKGILHTVFRYLSQLADAEWLFLDGSIVRAHQHSSGAACSQSQAIGKSRGGNTTKIHLSVDSAGLPIHFELSGGEVHDVVHAQSLITNSPSSSWVIADKGYDSEALRKQIAEQGGTAEYPSAKDGEKGQCRHGLVSIQIPAFG